MPIQHRCINFFERRVTFFDENQNYGKKGIREYKCPLIQFFAKLFGSGFTVEVLGEAICINKESFRKWIKEKYFHEEPPQSFIKDAAALIKNAIDGHQQIKGQLARDQKDQKSCYDSKRDTANSIEDETSNPMSKALEKDETSRGLLYKVKNAKTNETVGYLFGTQHETTGDDKIILNQKVIECLIKCKNLCLEKSIHMDVKNKYKNACKDNEFSEEAIDLGVAKWLKENLDYHYRGAEVLLEILAMEEKIKVHELESDSSISGAKETRKAARNLLVEICKMEDQLCREHGKKYIEKISKALNYEEAYRYIDDGYEELVSATKDITFAKKIRDLLRIWIVKCGLDAVKGFYSAGPIREPELPILCNRENLEQAWKIGDEQMLKECTKCPKDNFWTYHLDLIEDYERDTHMLKQFKPLLMGSSTKERCFIAIGAWHIFQNYNNVKLRLEKKGWKIINAYKDLS